MSAPPSPCRGAGSAEHASPLQVPQVTGLLGPDPALREALGRVIEVERVVLAPVDEALAGFPLSLWSGRDIFQP